MSPKVLWDVVHGAARAGIDKLAPHDLRRTCARLCHLAGGELDQIQFLLGQADAQSGLGCKAFAGRTVWPMKPHRDLRNRIDWRPAKSRTRTSCGPWMAQPCA